MGKGDQYTWGTEPDERLLPFPCDAVLDRFDEAYYRGVSIDAEPGVVFRWLCQMRVAPYSYDWIDNFGRRSPRTLTPGLDQLAVGQTVMTLFELVDFERDRHVTIRTRRDSAVFAPFGDAAISYLIVRKANGEFRLLVKLLVRYPRGPLGWFLRCALPTGDLIMMRRQLLNFKALAEGMASDRRGNR